MQGLGLIIVVATPRWLRRTAGAAGQVWRARPADDPGTEAPKGSTPGISGSQQSDWSLIVKLEGEAKAIAKTTGCASNECGAAPVGSRARGGPRYYLPYCAKTTDSVALYRKLGEIANAEQDYNRNHNIASTCEYRMPPLVESVTGACAAK